MDTWSLTAAGRPWTSQDWGANVLLALVARLGAWGETLLSLAFAGLAVAGFAVLWRAMAVRSPSIGWLSRVVWLSAGLVLAGPTLGVRVQVFDLLGSALTLYVLWNYLARRRTSTLVWLPVLALAWVNLHAGWPLLFLLGGAVVVGEMLDHARPGVIGQALAWHHIAAIAVALVVAAAVLALNPNGIDIYRYPLDTLQLTTLKAAVGEWQPARLDSLFGQLLVAFVMVAVLPTVAFAWRRMRTADVLILVGLTLMAFMAVRFLLILGPVGTAIIAVNLGPAVSKSRLGQQAASTLERMTRPRSDPLLVVLVIAVLALGTALALARSLPDAQARETAREQPVAAVDWIRAHDPGDRVFNRYEWGGYLGLQRPDQPIFIDGRADVYGDRVIAEYVRTIGLSIDPQTTFDRYAIDFVLFPPDSPLGAWLNASAKWRPVYVDDVAAVWVRA